ncbi:nitrate reductase [Methylovirgula ligni]|uniref:Assimilatory nitrate reductase catalytic subunit n=1 Tax=Methylovirgula ligni TaxID=569860 RepID=A0A3D9YPH6_9HYPH|nr:nitrate reductase [Methylovirgula ligni]QAY95034.1 nitrate reductase [Methylovirgula ligni]REF84500.1 assimilatory nitrate reductase catalytic subunit [Methylovirgula ligni]
MDAPATRTTCPYCGVGCGVLVARNADGTVTVRGDTEHPANFGRLCSKGSALGETVGFEDRLLAPQINGRRANWNEALDLVAATFSRTIAEHGPDSVAFYVSGQLLNEDYYVANKLMKGFIGSANIDTNSRLCMASSVAGHRRAFGADTVPGTYEDLELGDLVVLVGSNLAWCHPVLYQRIAAAKQKRPQMRIVLIDPRRTMTADIADIHLAVRPDGDVALFTGLLAWLADHDALDRAFIAAHTNGFDDAVAVAKALSLDEIADQTGVPADELRAFYTLFAHTEKAVTVYSQGVNQSSAGTDKVNAIINCHLATGRIGKPGTGPFSVTGQPNAMGGREVGGLANMLAAHMEIENPEHRDRVQRFWGAPRIASQAGLKAVEMFRAVAGGRVKAIWIMGTNPVVSMPEVGLVEAALKTCPFVVVSDVVSETDTLRLAHIKLPAAAWGEKDGTVTNSERRVSRQRPFLPSPGEARPDWEIVCDVAQRMGFGKAFSYASAAEIFAEHAALSAFENEGTRDFDIGAYAGLDIAQFEKLAPFQWPSPSGQARQRSRFFADGQFFTADSKARFVATLPKPETRTSDAYPLVLNTGRVRDHWHTMTRTGRSPRLSQHLAEPFAEIHPRDARRLGICDADIACLSIGAGSVLVRAFITPTQARGSVFVPMHWNGQFASAARINCVVPSTTDAVSGQPAFKHVPVQLSRFDAALYGFAVLREKPAASDADYWALAKCRDGWRVEFAFASAARDWRAFAAELFGCSIDADILLYQDATTGQKRFAFFADDRLAGALFLGAEPVRVSRDWAVDQLRADFAQPRSRLAIIAGRPGAGGTDRGATVCSCFSVGINQITAAIAEGCASVEAVGQATQAGTNCGSCRAEIKKILNASCRGAGVNSLGGEPQPASVLPSAAAAI